MSSYIYIKIIIKLTLDSFVQVLQCFYILKYFCTVNNNFFFLIFLFKNFFEALMNNNTILISSNYRTIVIL